MFQIFSNIEVNVFYKTSPKNRIVKNLETLHRYTSEYRPPLSMMLCTMNVAKDQHSTADSVDLDWRFDICAGLGGGGGVAITFQPEPLSSSAPPSTFQKSVFAQNMRSYGTRTDLNLENIRQIGQSRGRLFLNPLGQNLFVGLISIKC